MKKALEIVISTTALLALMGLQPAMGQPSKPKPSVSLNTEPVPKPIPLIKPKPSDGKLNQGSVSWPIVGDLGKTNEKGSSKKSPSMPAN